MIIRGDARSIPLADKTVQCVVTSPPYWGLRDYGTASWDGGDADCDHAERELRKGVNLAQSVYSTRGGAKKIAEVGWLPYRDICGKCGAKRIDQQIGLEPTPAAYVATIVAVFREVWRVLKPDGTVWLNLGDSYSGSGKGGNPAESEWAGYMRNGEGAAPQNRKLIPLGLKPKDLCGMPWRIAFALQADGWWLRSDIIWAKPNPMPESVTDRPTRSHEYLFLLTKRADYYYDADAIREIAIALPVIEARSGMESSDLATYGLTRGKSNPSCSNPAGRNKRDVWTINSEAFAEAHFATFPKKLVEPCILAGTSAKGECVKCGVNWVREVEVSYSKKSNGQMRGHKENNPGVNGFAGYPDLRKHVETTGCACNAGNRPNLVLDPFLGSGTVGEVCESLGRRWAGIELSGEYLGIARRRTAQMGFLWVSQ